MSEKLAAALYEAECYGIGATSDTNQRVILAAAKERHRALKIENVGQAAGISYVFQCSSPECGLLWDEDPHGHCPGCITECGHGWSCITRSITPLKEFRAAKKVDAA